MSVWSYRNYKEKIDDGIWSELEINNDKSRNNAKIRWFQNQDSIHSCGLVLLFLYINVWHR